MNKPRTATRAASHAIRRARARNEFQRAMRNEVPFPSFGITKMRQYKST
jgi:hypothetical protein